MSLHQSQREELEFVERIDAARARESGGTMTMPHSPPVSVKDKAARAALCCQYRQRQAINDQRRKHQIASGVKPIYIGLGPRLAANKTTSNDVAAADTAYRETIDYLKCIRPNIDHYVVPLCVM